jgi:hypothetical protein
MTEHHGSDRREVGRPPAAGVEDRRDLAEVVGAEDAGGDDRERLGVDLAGLSNWCTAPRGMQSASPGPTSIGCPRSSR